MAKFCFNCGAKLNEIQDVCLGCGRVLNKKNKSTIEKKENNYNVYIKVSGIVMIIIGIVMIFGMSYELYDVPILVYGIPGIFGILSGILTLCSINNKNLLLLSGVFYFIGAFVNFIGIIDVSIFMILSIIFGILNIVYSRCK